MKITQSVLNHIEEQCHLYTTKIQYSNPASQGMYLLSLDTDAEEADLLNGLKAQVVGSRLEQVVTSNGPTVSYLFIDETVFVIRIESVADIAHIPDIPAVGWYASSSLLRKNPIDAELQALIGKHVALAQRIDRRLGIIHFDELYQPEQKMSGPSAYDLLDSIL